MEWTSDFGFDETGGYITANCAEITFLFAYPRSLGLESETYVTHFLLTSEDDLWKLLKVTAQAHLDSRAEPCNVILKSITFYPVDYSFSPLLAKLIMDAAPLDTGE